MLGVVVWNLKAIHMEMEKQIFGNLVIFGNLALRLTVQHRVNTYL